MYSHLKNLAEIGVFRGQIASRTLEKKKEMNRHARHTYAETL